MEEPFQIVGCVLASKPSAEVIDAFVAQARLERAVVMFKTAQSATFVRLNAPDAALIMLACQAQRAQARSCLRFGFVTGVRPPASAGSQALGDALGVSNHNMLQAKDLAAGARDGEVLVSPQLAVQLIEAGFALRTKRVRLAGGRVVAACKLDLIAMSGANPERAQGADTVSGDTLAGDLDGHRTGFDSLPMPLEQSPRPASLGQAEPKTVQRSVPPAADLPGNAPRGAEPINEVLRALAGQAKEMARRQAELEARQEAAQARMAVVDQGSRAAERLAKQELELEAQLKRVQRRIELVDKLDRRLNPLIKATGEVERKLAEQLGQRDEVQRLVRLSDTLVTQTADAQQRLQAVAALQERLLPMTEQIAALTQALEGSQQQMTAVETRLTELDSNALALQQKLQSLAEREASVLALQAEVDAIHRGSAACRAELEMLAQRRAEVNDLRSGIEGLASRVDGADGKIAAIEARREMVDEALAHTNAITHMMSDIRLNLEALNDRRAEIDHVGDKLAQLDFTVQQAQNMLRALQRERELAERVEQGIKSRRARGAVQQAV